MTRVLRVVLLSIIAITLAMIAVRVVSYPPLARIPGGITFAIKPAVLLAMYAAAVVWITSRPDEDSVVRFGTPLGAVSGVVSVLHIAQENFITLPLQVVAPVTWAFIVAMFLPWAVAGYRVCRAGGRSASGALAGSWAAVVCMLLTIAFGFAQLLCCLSRLEQRDAASPDFLRSGWTDLSAFAIADIFDAGFWHLLLGPILGAFFGVLATAIARPRA